MEENQDAVQHSKHITVSPCKCVFVFSYTDKDASLSLYKCKVSPYILIMVTLFIMVPRLIF